MVNPELFTSSCCILAALDPVGGPFGLRAPSSFTWWLCLSVLHSSQAWRLFSPTLSYPFPSCPVLTPADPLPKLPLSTFLSFNSSQLDGFVSSESKFFLCIIPVITQFRKDSLRQGSGPALQTLNQPPLLLWPQNLTHVTGPYLEFHIFTDLSKEITKIQSIVFLLPAGKFFENRNLTSTNVLSM